MSSPTDTNRTTIDRYRTAADPLSATIDSVGPDAWAGPSPCEGWATRDVVRHIIDTQRSFLTDHDVDLGPAPDVDADPAAAWRAHRHAVEAAIADEAVTSTPFEGHFGPTTIGETLERFYIFDLVAHRWDIATAAGQDAGLTDDELDQIEAGAASFGPALYAEGVCRPGVDAPADADRQTRVLALLGRQA